MSYSHLNLNQKHAVQSTEGPLLILAGAGSGKTSTMVYRIAHLIQRKKCRPNQILGLSFTNKAARELKERVLKETKLKNNTPFISTFHSLCARLLRQFAKEINHTPQFSIITEKDQEEIIREILKNIKVDDRKFHPRMIGFMLSQAKNQFLNPEQARDYFLGQGSKDNPSDYGIVAASVYDRYMERLKSNDSMDFDDLLFNMVHLLESNQAVRKSLSEKFRYILIDEFQDTNPTQFRIIQSLTQEHNNICVVGDDDQSIYAWRGAEPSLILNFHRTYPGTTIITLDQNYRSTPTILDAANAVIAKNKNRHPKKLWSEQDDAGLIEEMILEDDPAEAEWIADTLEERGKHRAWSDFAILFRANAQSRAFEEALRMKGIPYKLIGSMSYLDRKEIKDMMCYWKVILNAKDDASLRRIMNRPARKIGPKAVSLASEYATQNSVSLLTALNAIKEEIPRSKAGIDSLILLLNGLRESLSKVAEEPAAVSQWALESIQTIQYKDVLLSDYPEEGQKVVNRMENVEELANGIGHIKIKDLMASNRGKTPESILSHYLSKLQLDEEEKDSDDDEKENKNQVNILTFHASKGLEFPTVFMVGCEDGLIPHRKVIESLSSLDEERRLFYVGMTRAKRELIITRCKHRIRYGKPVPQNPSRFIEDIPKDLVQTLDQSITPDPNSKESWDRHENRVKGFLDQIRNQLSSEK